MTELVTIRSGKWELSGVVHGPAVATPKRVGVVLLHENFNTKFGTHRMFYQVGEALAAAGFYALRYDNRGMCDSPGINPLTFDSRVADVGPATQFFKKKYHLDSVYFWGLCMGAAVALHASAQSGAEMPEGIMLCSLLADPGDVSLPQFGYGASPSRVVAGLSRGNVLKRALRFVTDGTYRRDVGRILKGVVARVAAREPELDRLKKYIGQVGELLRQYRGPIVLVFGDKDPCWTHFDERVNANDQLGLTKMGSKRTFLLLEDGDHTFSSMKQTQTVIQWTVEWAQALRDGTAAQYSESKLGKIVGFLLHQLLTESAKRNPNGIAVDGGESKLTYSELDVLSNQIAHQLRADGVCNGDRVGVFLPKSPQTVAALLGILKAGAAYVPVDPHSPSSRAAYVLGNCSVRALITNSSQLRKLAPDLAAASEIQSILLTDEPTDVPVVASLAGSSPVSFAKIAATRPAANPGIALIENDLAYILYTSGSTGQPKGVMISHLNSLTFVNWAHDEYQITQQDRVSSHAPFHFDLSILDLFCTLKAGGTICLVPNDVAAFPVRLAQWIAEKGITVWYSVPSALIQLVEHGHLDRHNYHGLRWVLFAGEVFPIKYLRRLVQQIPHAAYSNLYGPTETNVCTYYHVQSSDVAPERTEPVPIGKACANTEVFALDEQGRVVPPGQEGELYVRCSTVMKGYWGRPDATAATVLPNPLNRAYADVMYRTGDIVKLMPSGDYQYVGRRDKMVKSRGYRIELGEIETALYAHSGVKEAAVVAVPDERIGARLIGYVVAGEGALTQSELMKFCSERVPRYMVPERIELCGQLPKTSTGKIDKKTLENESKLYAERTAN